MKFKELVYDHCNMNFNRLSVLSGVPVTSLHNIDKRNSFNNTNIEIIKKIADTLNLTLDEIYDIMQK